MAAADRVGVEGPHDVDVAELGGSADFTMKPFEHLRVGQFVLADHLQGDDPPEPFVLRLEDLAHAALPKSVEHAVRPEHQVGAPALEELVGLEVRQQAGANQLDAEGLGVGEARLEVGDSGQVGLVHQPNFLQRRHQVLAVGGHLSSDRGGPGEVGESRAPSISVTVSVPRVPVKGPSPRILAPGAAGRPSTAGCPILWPAPADVR